MADQQLSTEQRITIKEYLAAPAVQKRTEEMLKDRTPQFVTSVLSMSANDPQLSVADPRSLFNACLMAASLDLPINKNLGFAHILPYNNTKKGIVEAQFQMGWKGFVQLAQRTGLYKTINATKVYEGQLVDEDPLLGNTYDWKAKKSDTVIGYVSIFKLTTGFQHEVYMSMDEIKGHAQRYSQAYKKKYGPWIDNFDAMALKTVVKLNISKWGPMSVELQNAIEADQAIIDEQGKHYVDGTDLLDEVKATDEQKDAIVANALGGEEVTEEDDAVEAS